MKKKATSNSLEYKLYGLTTLSLVVTVFITLRVVEMVQAASLGSVGFYPALVLIGSVLAIIVGRKRMDIVLLNTVAITITLTAVFFWFFGVTSAGSTLFGTSSSEAVNSSVHAEEG